MKLSKISQNDMNSSNFKLYSAHQMCTVWCHQNHQQKNFRVLEQDQGIIKFEALRCVHKLREMWNGKCELLEVVNLQPFEVRGRDPTNNHFQVSANALEAEETKVRKYNVRHDWGMCEMPLQIMFGNRE